MPAPLPLYDAHNHLQDEWLAPHLDRVAPTLPELGLRRMVVAGTLPEDWARVETLATRFPFVLPAYGVHPWRVGHLRAGDDAWLGELESRLTADPRASIGEIGIDRWMIDGARPDDARLAGVRRASLDEQLAVFIPQLQLAARLNRPATIHCLQAWGALDHALRAHPAPARGFLLHAYGGPVEMIKTFAARGAYFSFNGSFLDPRKRRHLETFKHIPPDRLLIETDAPAMPLPQAWRTHKLPPAPDGTTVNHPGNIEATYAGLASHLGLSIATLAAQVETNFHRLFGA